MLLWWGFALTAVAFIPIAVLAAPLAGVGALATLTLVGDRSPGSCKRSACSGGPSSFRSWRGSGTGPPPAAVDAIFDAANRYLGVAIGEHLGYLLTGSWTILLSAGMLATDSLPGWFAIAGIVVGAALLVGMLEFVGPAEPTGWGFAGATVAIAYTAWSVWLIVAGILLLRPEPRRTESYAAARAPGQRGRRLSSAATRKHAAPRKVPAFAQNRLTRSVVDGMTYAPIAESPKNTEPSRLSQVHRHVRAVGSQSLSRSVVATAANALAMRKQTEPNASGRQPLFTRVSLFRAGISASVVLTLKNSVPMNCTADAHQSNRSGLDAPRRGGRRPLRLNWMMAAAVKKRAPMKKVRSATGVPTALLIERDGPDQEEEGADGEPPGLPPETRGLRCRHGQSV